MPSNPWLYRPHQPDDAYCVGHQAEAANKCSNRNNINHLVEPSAIYLHSSSRGHSGDDWRGETRAPHVFQRQEAARKTAEHAAEAASLLIRKRTIGMVPFMNTGLPLAGQCSPPRDSPLSSGTLLADGVLKEPRVKCQTFPMVPFGSVEAADDEEAANTVMSEPGHHQHQQQILKPEKEQQQQQQQPQQQHQQQQYHPIGAMFHPELPKQGVLSVISEVFCRPGFTSGPGDAKRLMRDVRSGRVNVRTMSRLLLWLGGDRAERQLRERGLKFVGPGADGDRPYTTGFGMTHLLEEVRQFLPLLNFFFFLASEKIREHLRRRCHLEALLVQCIYYSRVQNKLCITPESKNDMNIILMVPVESHGRGHPAGGVPIYFANNRMNDRKRR